MLNRAFPDEVTTVDTTAVYDLGLEWYMDPEEVEQLAIAGLSGPCVWRYVYNDEASNDFVAGSVVAIDAATANYDGIVAVAGTPSTRVLGVAQWGIAAGSYGWILKSGIGNVLAGTETIDVNEGVYVSATDAGTGMEAGAAVTAANTTITEAHLAGPFAWATENAAAAALAVCKIACD